MYDLQAYGLGGIAPPGWPKFTGGWSVSTPAVGSVSASSATGKLQVAMPTREGNLFVWQTQAPLCGSQEWPKYQHDLWNSGDFATDAKRPGVVGNATLAG